MAESDPQDATTTATLLATYTSPTNAAFTHTQPLPLPTTTSPKDRVAYLSALRTATVEMQERINKELTERMEEDKAKEASVGVNGSGVGGNGKRKATELDEKKEEENYGEEVVDED